jgi:hypothetical protein
LFRGFNFMGGWGDGSLELEWAICYCAVEEKFNRKFIIDISEEGLKNINFFYNFFIQCCTSLLFEVDNLF